MRSDNEYSNDIYKVLVNEEEQYSVWPAQEIIPLGWRDIGMMGTKTECLAYISIIWTDMHPLQVQNQLKTVQKLLES